MPRPRASVPPDAIRIEDEVWQEAFVERERSRPSAPRHLRAIEGGLAAPVAEPQTAPPETAPAAEPTPNVQAAEPKPLPPRTARAHGPGTGIPGRRTVTIRGYGAERNLPWPDPARRRPQRPVYERAGFRPDRLAMWAVLLGFLLVVVAVASGHG